MATRRVMRIPEQDKRHSQDRNQILHNDKNQQILIVCCTPGGGRSLLSTISLLLYCNIYSIELIK